ncbi:MAG: hypothetical protein IPP72_04960 [Chitinophagaceae bacterium]|nr:hypothetical protein [Chitinophagaceae bacterium]
MKKLTAGLVIVLVLFFSLAYLMVPNVITINTSLAFQNNIKGLFRTLSETRNWSKWWPGKFDSTGKKLLLNGNEYTVPDYTATSIVVEVNNPTVSEKSSLLFVPLKSDSIRLEWQVQIPTSYNPFKRVKIYFATSGLQHDFHSILASIKSYYTNDERIYGLDIRRESVKDTSLVFTYDSSKGYPSTEKIYSMIGELRNYIDMHSAIATDSPMLNIYSSDHEYYLTKVAIPTNKILPSSGKIFYKWVLPHGNILVADVKGNIQQTDSAFATISHYVHDYNLTAPAIPFFKLITNRLQEKDSSKWVTRIYYPVMYYN